MGLFVLFGLVFWLWSNRVCILDLSQVMNAIRLHNIFNVQKLWRIISKLKQTIYWIQILQRNLAKVSNRPSTRYYFIIDCVSSSLILFSSCLKLIEPYFELVLFICDQGMNFSKRVHFFVCRRVRIKKTSRIRFRFLIG